MNDAEAALVARAHSHTQIMPGGKEWPPASQRAPILILRGWACRLGILPNGQRQIFDFLLPGDVVGFTQYPAVIASVRIFSLTEVVAADAAPFKAAVMDPLAYPRLANLLQTGRVQEVARLLDLIVELGQLSAKGRMAALLLSLRGRLRDAGLADADTFPLPVSQEIIGEHLGLSNVHVSRVLKMLRVAGLISQRAGYLTIHDLPGLA